MYQRSSRFNPLEKGLQLKYQTCVIVMSLFEFVNKEKFTFYLENKFTVKILSVRELISTVKEL